MKQNKFIITTNGELRLGYVEYHKHLLNNGERGCYGGDLFSIDKENKIVKMGDCSGDFGFPKFEYLKSVAEFYDVTGDPGEYGDYFVDLSDYTLIYTKPWGEVTFEKKVSEL